MTTTTPPINCIRCARHLWLAPYGLGYCGSCAREICANGEGDSIGLPTVPADEVDEAILQARLLLERPQDEVFIALTSSYCTECSRTTDDFDEEDNDLHVVMDDFLLIECEGFQTAAIRYAGTRLVEVPA